MKNLFTLIDLPALTNTLLLENYRFSKIDFSSTGNCYVFISHAHDDLDKIDRIIDFLEKNYGCKCYIDEEDDFMPTSTCFETAKRLKNIITKSDKFIFIATSKSMKSRWCNWELGMRDGINYNNNIAIWYFNFDNDVSFKGNEYFELYPSITFYDSTDKYSSGEPIEKGYYVRTMNKDRKYTIMPLKDWLKK